jgi:hypothetical protein
MPSFSRFVAAAAAAAVLAAVTLAADARQSSLRVTVEVVARCGLAGRANAVQVRCGRGGTPPVQAAIDGRRYETLVLQPEDHRSVSGVVPVDNARPRVTRTVTIQF